MEISIPPPASAGGTGANWLSGAGTPDGGIGSVGDYYVETVTGEVYKKIGTLTWTDQGFSLKGEAGSGGTPQKAFASKLTQYARSRVCRVAHYGTSIAAMANSASLRFCDALQSQLGDSGNEQLNMGGAGGSFDTPYFGWQKQYYGGNMLIRARGDSSSQTLSWSKYVKRFVIHYSTEVGGSTCDIYLDDVYHGTIDCGGAQSVGNEYVISVASTATLAKLTIMPPASGYVYLDHIGFLKDDVGIDVLNYSLGGSALKNFSVLGGPTANQVAGIPIVGDSGLNGSFMNDGPNTKPDLIIISYIVNDAAAGMSNYTNYFVPSVNKITEWAYENDVQIVYIVEMAGHFAMQADPYYAAYNSMRDHLLAQNTWPHVSVIDWNYMAGLTTTDPAQLLTLANRYYNATDVDIEAGTATGDFIHPNGKGYSILAEALYNGAGITIDGLQDKNYLVRRDKKINNFPYPSATDINAVNNVGYTELLTNNMVEEKLGSILGPSMNLISGVEEPCWVCADELNYQHNWTEAINAAGTEDAFGKYKNVANVLGYVYHPYRDESVDQIPNMTVTILARGEIGSPTNVGMIYQNVGSGFEPDYVVQGNIIDAGEGNPAILKQLVHTYDKPRLYHFTVSGTTTRTSLQDYLGLTGYIYKVWVTPTDYPCIAGRQYEDSRSIVPSLIVTDDLVDTEIMINQLYKETVDGIEIEKICIGKGVKKPFQSSKSSYGIYRVQNRTVPIMLNAALNGTVALSTYDSRLGGVTRTTTANPVGYVTSSGSQFTNTSAEKWFTATGKHNGSVGVQIVLVAPSQGKSLYLNKDGVTWNASSSTSNNLIVDTTDFFNRTLAFTFQFPTVAEMAIGTTWMIHIRETLGTFVNKGGDWFVCQGKSACV